MMIPMLIQHQYPPMSHVSPSGYDSQDVSIILFYIFKSWPLHCYVLDLPADLMHRVLCQKLS